MSSRAFVGLLFELAVERVVERTGGLARLTERLAVSAPATGSADGESGASSSAAWLPLGFSGGGDVVWLDASGSGSLPAPAVCVAMIACSLGGAGSGCAVAEELTAGSPGHKAHAIAPSAIAPPM